MSAELLNIGQMLDELREEFPELTHSKVRYLEEQGLLSPQRTPAGYRKFSFSDVERMRFILRQQANFWPLNEIRQTLDDMPTRSRSAASRAATSRTSTGRRWRASTTPSAIATSCVPARP